MNFVRARRTAGLGLMLSSLVVGIFAVPAATAAEGDPDDVPEETTSYSFTAEDSEIARMGFWEGNPSDYGNNAVTKSYPPEAVCLVQPQFCNFPEGDEDPSGDLNLGSQGNDLNDQIGDQSGETQDDIQEQDQGKPEDPVPPDTLPVSVAFGQKNYRSAIEFPLPDVPDGHEVDAFTIFLEQGNPTYNNSSPALRQAVLAGLTCARDCDQDEFEKVVTEDCSQETSGTPCPREEEPLQVEMCAIVDSKETDFDDTEWKGERSQPENTLPAVDCILGSLGTIYSGVEVTREDGSTEEVTLWGFDMTFALQAWEDAEIPYAGVELRPASAENLAYGDPDPSYSKQVTFANAIHYAASTSEPPPPPAPFDPGASTFGSGGASGSSGSTGGSSGGDFFSTPPTPASGSPISNDTVTPQPQTATGDSTGAGDAQQGVEQPQTVAANAPLGQPETPWWLWLLVVPFFGGAYLLQRSLVEELAVATERSGAMTRLLERQAAQREPDLITN